MMKVICMRNLGWLVLIQIGFYESVLNGFSTLSSTVFWAPFSTLFSVLVSTQRHQTPPHSTMMAPSALSLTTSPLHNASFTIVFSFHSDLLLRINGKNCQLTHGDINCSVAQPLLSLILTFPVLRLPTTSSYGMQPLQSYSYSLLTQQPCPFSINEIGHQLMETSIAQLLNLSY